MEMKTLDFPLEIKALSETGMIEGYASTFGNVDLGGDIVDPRAFDDTLADMEKSGRRVPLLWHHDPTQPIGVWTSLAVDGKGLVGKAQTFPDEDPLAKRLCMLIKHRVINGLSIGYTLPPGGRVQDEKKPHANRLMKVNVREISLVTMPMNEKARITAVKMFADGQVPSERELEDRFRDEWGLSNKLAKTFVSALKPHLRRDVEPADDPRAAFLKKLLDRL